MDKMQKLIKTSDRVIDIWFGFCVGWVWFGKPEWIPLLFITVGGYLSIVVVTLIVGYFIRDK